VNHSCAPNAVFISSFGKWLIKTLRPLRAGEEITISYLGWELLQPTNFRQQQLWRSKCFNCCCSRCMHLTDPLRSRPCSFCNKPQSTVKSLLPHLIPHFYADKRKTFDRHLLAHIFITKGGQGKWRNCFPNEGAFAQFVSDRWLCPHCGKEESSAELLRIERTMGRAAQRLFSLDLSAHPKRQMGSHAGVSCLSDDFVGEALCLLEDSWCVLGPRHWVTQTGLLFLNDLHISFQKFQVSLSVAVNPATSHESAYCRSFCCTEMALQILVFLWDWLSFNDLLPACWLYSRAQDALASVRKLPYADVVDAEDPRAVDITKIDIMGPIIRERLRENSPPANLLPERVFGLLDQLDKCEGPEDVHQTEKKKK